ncbi:MAG: TfoX/Sxy family protein [Candidatus Neomarinimicrobiota bacterium]
MSYNTSLELRINDSIAGLEGVEIKKMFGGVGFLIHGKMFCGIHKDYLILRLSEDDALTALEELVNSRPFDITGRPMKGWVMVPPPGIPDDGLEFRMWISRTREFASSLPPK